MLIPIVQREPPEEVSMKDTNKNLICRVFDAVRDWDESPDADTLAVIRAVALHNEDIIVWYTLQMSCFSQRFSSSS